jgi:hypothetical protein
MSEEDKLKHARESGRATLAAIIEMVDALIAAEEADDEDAREAARERIMEDPLSLRIRSDWHSPGDKSEAAEYELLLGTGGPAVRIVGTLDRGDAETAVLEVQDWFTPWTRLVTSTGDDEKLLRYAQCFYFGE